MRIIGIILLTTTTQVVSGQLKIYILAGQSNMQGSRPYQNT